MADLRIDRDTAHRAVARMLREKMSPADANQFATKICDGLQAVMPTPTRPGLHGWRMIPKYIPYQTSNQVVADFQRHFSDHVDEGFAQDMWNAVYAHGRDLPDDVVV